MFSESFEGPPPMADGEGLCPWDCPQRVFVHLEVARAEQNHPHFLDFLSPIFQESGYWFSETRTAFGEQ